MDKDERFEFHTDFIKKSKVCSFREIIKNNNCSAITLRRDIKSINAITSYTHKGEYITLPDIPTFNEFGIWFFDGNIGFTSFKSSFDLIVNTINKSEKGITKEELDEILMIDCRKQIQILLKKNTLYRVKLGNKYCYISEELSKNRKQRLKLFEVNKEEEYYDSKIGFSDLLAVLKIALLEANIEIKSIGTLIKKHSLSVPAKKIEQLLLKYNLYEKKSS